MKLGWAYGKMGKWTEAEQAINKALSLDPRSLFALGLQAWIAVNNKKWKDGMVLATKTIKAAVHLNNISTARQILSWVYPCYLMGLENATITKKHNILDQKLQEFKVQVPDSSFPYGFEGWKQAQQQLWQHALHNFQQATNQYNVSRWILLNQAIAQEHLNDIQGAINTYQLYQQKCPENNIVWFKLHQSLIPDSAFVYFRLGSLFGKLGQWEKAKENLKKAISFHQQYAEAYHNLGWVFQNIKDSAGEIENSRELLSTYQQAVQLYLQQNKSKEAQQINNAFQLAGIDL